MAQEPSEPVELAGAALLFKSGYSAKDSASIKQSAEQAQSGMGRINTAMSSPPMRLAALVPWFGTAVSNAQHFSSAGEELVKAAVPVAENFDPNVYRNGAVNLNSRTFRASVHSADSSRKHVTADLRM